MKKRKEENGLQGKRVRTRMTIILILMLTSTTVYSDGEEVTLSNRNFVSYRLGSSSSSSPVTLATYFQEVNDGLQVIVRGVDWFRVRLCFGEVTGEWRDMVLVKAGKGLHESSFSLEEESSTTSHNCSRLVVPESSTYAYLSSGGPGNISVRSRGARGHSGTVLEYLGHSLSPLPLTNTSDWEALVKVSDGNTSIVATLVGPTFRRSKQCHFHTAQKWHKVEILKRRIGLAVSSFGRRGWTESCSRLLVPESSSVLYLSNGGPGKFLMNLKSEPTQSTAPTPDSHTITVVVLLVASLLCVMVVGMAVVVCWRYQIRQNRDREWRLQQRVPASQTNGCGALLNGPLPQEDPSRNTYLEMGPINPPPIPAIPDHRTTCAINQENERECRPPSVRGNPPGTMDRTTNEFKLGLPQSGSKEELHSSTEHIYEEITNFNLPSQCAK